MNTMRLDLDRFLPNSLQTHAQAERLQSQTDRDYAASQNKEITYNKIASALEKLHPEQKKILREYFDSLNPEQKHDVITRLNDLASMAEKTFAPIMREWKTTPTDEQLQLFEKSFFDWFALVMPTTGTKTPWLIQVEEQTGLSNINTGNRIWTSQTIGRFQTQEQIAANPILEKDIRGWQESSGLIIHTAAAAWGIERFVTIIQSNLKKIQERGGELNDRQKSMLLVDGKLMRIWLLFHDAMRTLSHDTFVHAAALPLFAELIGLPEMFIKDFDLPEIMGFMHEHPEKENGAGNMADGLPPFKIEDYMRDNPDLLMQNGEYYIERTLQLLKEKGVYNGPNESILLFWIIDAYSKLQPFRPLGSFSERIPEHVSDFAFPSQKAVEEHLDTLLQETKEEEEKEGKFPSEYFVKMEQTVGVIRRSLIGLYTNPHFLSSNRQPNDTNEFFLGRYLTRSELGATNTDKMYLYYSRQNDLAFAVFDWIRTKLDIDKQDIWKFFFELTEVSHRMLDANNKFHYIWNNGETSPLGWKTDRTVTRPQVLQRTPLSIMMQKK